MTVGFIEVRLPGSDLITARLAGNSDKAGKNLGTALQQIIQLL
jgi:hypothetical protein